MRVRVECSDYADTPCRLQLAVHVDSSCASDAVGGAGGSGAGDSYSPAAASSSSSYSSGSSSYSGDSSSYSSGDSTFAGLSTTTWIIIGCSAGGALLAALGERCRCGVLARLYSTCGWAVCTCMQYGGAHPPTTSNPSSAAAHPPRLLPPACRPLVLVPHGLPWLLLRHQPA